MTLVCTGCRRRFDLIVDTPYTRMLAAFLSQCPSCGGAVERLSDLILSSATMTAPNLMADAAERLRYGLFGAAPAPVPADSPAPTVPYALTDDDRTFLRVNRIDPEI